MSEIDNGEEFDVLEAVREDPPRVRETDDLTAVARLRLGNAMYVHETRERDDGRLVAFLGVCKPTDTSVGALDREITFLNYAPVGALVATPAGDGEYTVRLPSRDDIDEGIRARERRENDHRATVLPPVRNLLLDAVAQHAAVTDGPSDDYRAGVHAGMARMADVMLRELMRRWEAPYKGEKRWNSGGADA